MIKLFSWLLIGVNTLLNLAGIPMRPNPYRTVDMSKFGPEPVWREEFDGGALDRATWQGHYMWGSAPTPRRDGYWDYDMCEVTGGALHIKTAYMPEGMNGGPAGWYSCGIDTGASYRQTYGYFETRCILPKGGGLWSAFWLYCEGVCDTAGQGEDGTEIDIFESGFYNQKLKCMRSAVSGCLHWNGYEEAHQSIWGKHFAVTGGDPYEEFHTYGLEWNAKEYIWYIDGMEYHRSSKGGVSKVPEFIILSVETKLDGWTKDINETTGAPTDYVVDYVRVWEYQ